MDINALNKANIDNLTDLWKKWGTLAHTPLRTKELHASSSWPHRYWFDWDTDSSLIPDIDKTLASIPQHGIIPVWNGSAGNINPFENTLVQNGFKASPKLTAMYLTLNNPVKSEHSPGIIKTIQTHQDIETWAKISGLAFGYKIDASVIHKIADDPDIQLFLFYHQGQACATALLYKTKNIIGLHQFGVLEKYRRLGIANALMHHLIATCHAWQSNYITLQASPIGEILYKRLGFKQQFKFHNYLRDSN